MTEAAVSVVIPTHDRVQRCRAAVQSALAQTVSPLEVLVCDDASSDATELVFTRWVVREPRLRYLRLKDGSGSPAVPRNAGVAAARGEWVAFLDDDDEWLPHKLEFQLDVLLAGGVDLVASNAFLTSGATYFAADAVPAVLRRRELLSNNPVIMSTAVVRRSLLQAVGGFPEDRRLAGIEDYLAWMALADLGARFRVLERPLARYSTEGTRLSRRGRTLQREVVRQLARRWLRRPRDRELSHAFFVHARRAIALGLSEILARWPRPPGGRARNRASRRE